MSRAFDEEYPTERIVAGRFVAAALGLASALAFGRTVMDFGQSMGWISGLWSMMFLYTHWAELITAVIFIGIALGNRWCARASVVGSTLILLGIMTVHYWLFSPHGDYFSAPLRAKITHGPLLLAALVYWFMIVRPGQLRWRDAHYWTIGPLIYTAYGLIRGAMTGLYPYQVADVNRYGYRVVFLLVGITYLLSLGTGLLIVFVDRLRSRRAGGTSETPAGGTMIAPAGSGEA
jgi:hypothetical protein